MTKFILFSITTLILWITTPNNPKPKENTLTSGQQETVFTGKGTLRDWQSVLANPDDVSKNERNRVIELFATQIRHQIDSLAKKK